MTEALRSQQPGFVAPGSPLIDVEVPCAPPIKRTVRTTRGATQPEASRYSTPELVVTEPGSLIEINLRAAPPIKRSEALHVRRPRLPVFALLFLGGFLFAGPIIGGLFAKAAAGEQMINQFSPYMERGSLSRYRADLTTLQQGTSGINDAFRQQHIAAGRFPLLANYRHESSAILSRASNLLGLVSATRPEYQHVSEIGGFDRLPFLIALVGMVAICGGCVLIVGVVSRARGAALLVILMSAALAAYPFAGGLYGGATAGTQMIHSLGSIMTPREVRQLQDDFVVIVEAVGEVETSFRGVAQSGPAATDMATLVHEWPRVSSDLASLVGVIDDNIANFNALKNLNGLTSGVGVPGLVAFPWLLVGAGTLSGALSIAAWPRREKETV